MITCVRSDNGYYVHLYYKEIICWQGLHILYAIMAVLVSIIFILISVLFDWPVCDQCLDQFAF